jgi:archaellum component FlaG (FlaF/FlaG flagellin family)
MKKITFFTIVLLFSASFSLLAQTTTITYHNESDKKEKKDGPVATFDKIVNDFGNIEQGIPKTAEFTLTNNGNEPLLISYAKASCGCTNLKYSNEPVLPKKSTTISVTYNAAAPGPFIKTITVQTNADENKVILQIKGTVNKKNEPTPEQK